MHIAKAKEPKQSVDELRENFLAGPADAPIDQVSDTMGVDRVVVSQCVPKMEKIIFRNNRDPGYPLTFHYSSKTHPFHMYNLIDGQEYSLPIEVVMHLEGCKENVEKYRRNAAGLPEIYIAGHRTHFICERAR